MSYRLSAERFLGSLYFYSIERQCERALIKTEVGRMAATGNTSVKKETFIGSVGGFFKDFFVAVAKGDFFVKLSLIWFGAGYIRRKQFIRTLLITAVEAAIILFSIFFAPQYITKLGTLGTVKMEQVFNISTMQWDMNEYDDSFQILLFSVVSILIWVVSLFIWMKNVITV